MALFGNKARFAAEVGQRWARHRELRRVDLWAAGHHLTCDDNTAFVGQIIGSIRGTIAALHRGAAAGVPAPDEVTRRRMLADGGQIAPALAFPAWGPTTDNIVGMLTRGETEGHLQFAFRFWRPSHIVVHERGVVFVIELATAELLEVLEQVVGELAAGAP